MLSSKYYQALAALLKTSQNLSDFKQNLEHYLANENPRFNKTRFEKATQ